MSTDRPRMPMPGRILGLYALSVMEREGALYGYALAERVAQRTAGSWRPGPGAIYPALESLARRRLAQASREGRRRVYRVTPEGRRFLRHLRRQMLWRTRAGPELGMLWSEVAGHADPGGFLVDRLQSHLERILDYLGRETASPARRAALRADVRGQLEHALERIRSARPPARGRARRAPRPRP